MFINNQPKEQQKEYLRLLNLVGSLSNLFSDSSIPYLYYRVAENIFCRAFEADNLSRFDGPFDAQKSHTGVGIKTYLEGNGKTLQKVAEFNAAREVYKDFESKPQELMCRISELRNKRVESAKSQLGVNEIVYHCVTRQKNKFLIYEEPMDLIKLDKLKLIKSVKNSVSFTDGIHEYNFNISKSTLLKRFHTKKFLEVDIKIIEDPFKALDSFLIKEGSLLKAPYIIELPSIILPLYSDKDKGRTLYVPERSGLNQWNANGRDRNNREVYIPIPSWIHEKFGGFLPPPRADFHLHLPNKKILIANVCQAGSKALMSNPNKALGNWLLDEVLRIPSRKLVTYEMLEEVGIDSVQVTKIDDGNYAIDFKEIGTFEEFKEKHNTAVKGL